MNKTIKIIDLLNKIANGEEPSKKIKYDGRLYHLNAFKNNYFDDLDCSFIDFKNIHDTVEIIEDNDKLEKIPYEFNLGYINTNDKDLVIKEMNKTINGIYVDMNKVIDHINKIEEKLGER